MPKKKVIDKTQLSSALSELRSAIINSKVESSQHVDELMHETMMILAEVCTSLYGQMSQWNPEDPVVQQFQKFERLLEAYYG